MDTKKVVEVLESLFLDTWSKDTSADPDNWTPQNPAWGQCAVTALIVQNVLGGNFIRLDLTRHPDPKVAAMGSHYFNATPFGDFDLTKSQFTDQNAYERSLEDSQCLQVRTREYLLSNPNTKRRYDLLLVRTGL
jgi:hypothetical protein